MHTSYGDMDVAIPRDRSGDYEPQLIRKYQNTVTQDMEEKILSMYAKGMTTGDIESHMRELYDIDISDSTISRITDKILPIVKEWQERPLEEVYAVESYVVPSWSCVGLVILTKVSHLQFSRCDFSTIHLCKVKQTLSNTLQILRLYMPHIFDIHLPFFHQQNH